MQVELTDDDALVLLELLAGYGESDEGRQLVIRHAAERNALWALEGQLQKELVAPFHQDYQAQVSAARRRLEEQGGGW